MGLTMRWLRKRAADPALVDFARWTYHELKVRAVFMLYGSVHFVGKGGKRGLPILYFCLMLAFLF